MGYFLGREFLFVVVVIDVDVVVVVVVLRGLHCAVCGGIFSHDHVFKYPMLSLSLSLCLSLSLSITYPPTHLPTYPTPDTFLPDTTRTLTIGRFC